MILLKTELKLT